jgi:hypothetical protein
LTSRRAGFWSREDLAARSGVGAETAKKLRTVLKWQRALEKAGVKFLDPTEDEGVRIKTAQHAR